MSEEDRIELKEELSIYSKEELLEKYLDELEENHILTEQWYKSSQRLNNLKEEIREYAIWQKENPTYDNIWREYEVNKLLKILDKGE